MFEIKRCILNDEQGQSLIRAGINLLTVTSRTVYSMKTSGESIAEDDNRFIEGMVTYAIIKDFRTWVFTLFKVLNQDQVKAFTLGRLNGEDSWSVGSSYTGQTTIENSA